MCLRCITTQHNLVVKNMWVWEPGPRRRVREPVSRFLLVCKYCLVLLLWRAGGIGDVVFLDGGGGVGGGLVSGALANASSSRYGESGGGRRIWGRGQAD